MQTVKQIPLQQKPYRSLDLPFSIQDRAYSIQDLLTGPEIDFPYHTSNKKIFLLIKMQIRLKYRKELSQYKQQKEDEKYKTNNKK